MIVFINNFYRAYFASLFMLATCFSLQGQNLVPNPGFEEITSCPEPNEVTSALPWISATSGSPDLFNICGVNNNVSVPSNWQGYQEAHSGNGYAGFYVFNTFGLPFKEYIQTSLITPMVAGEVYWVSFYVSLSDNSAYALDGNGVHFSEDAIYSDELTNMDCCSAQVFASDVITSKTEWTLISGCYEASGNEQYMTIGNFYTAFEGTQINVGGFYPRSYYYVDDVYVGLDFTLGEDLMVCGDSVMLDATIQQNATYLWQDGSTNPTFNATDSGTYWVEMTSNCGVVSDTIDVTLNPYPTVEIGNDTTLCEGAVLTLDVTTLNATYQWQDSSTGSTFDVSQEGTYWVEVSVNNCSSIDTISIDYDLMDFELGNDTTLCDGETLTLDVTFPDATYLWQDNSTNPTFDVTEEGMYWVEITDNCGIQTDTMNVYYDSPANIDLGNNTTPCEGDTLTLDATTPNATYLWQDGSTDSIFNVTQSGNYAVFVTVNNCSAFDFIQIDFDPSPTIELGNDTIFCEGEVFTLDATTPNSTYLWQDNSTNPTIEVTEQGAYWVEVFLDNCSDSDTIQVDFDPIPYITFGNDTTLCDGEAFILDASTQNANYMWQNNSTNAVFNVTESGTYWVEIVNNCGMASDTINAIFNPIPTVELGNDTTLCEGESFTLDVTTANATYLWQDNSTGSTFDITQQGTYWVEVFLDNCSAMDTIQVDINALPIVDFGNDITLCDGDEFILDATTPNATYLWQDNSTNSTFNVMEAGTYWVAIADSCGIDSDTIIVEYSSIPTVDLGNDTTLCDGDEFTLDVTTPDVTYEWQDNSTNSTFIVYEQGTYWVQITNHCGSISDSFFVEGEDCEVILEMPNVFTPNGDGKNDSFIPLLSNNIVSMHTVIYNRWGAKIFETDNLFIEWTGEDASDGTYFWTIQFTDVYRNVNSQSGYVTLIK